MAATKPTPNNFHKADQDISCPVNGFNTSQKSKQATIAGRRRAKLVIVQAIIAFFKSEYPLSDSISFSFSLLMNYTAFPVPIFQFIDSV